MQEIINILMRRDCISENEARNILDECIDELQDAIMYGRYLEAEDIVASYLGLEPDYLELIINDMF